MEKRLRDINSDLNITSIHEFIKEDRIREIISKDYDYVVDAIDTLLHKVSLIAVCLEKKINIVSAMGAGGKVDPLKIQVADIEKSYNCKLAKVVRKRLHRRGIYGGFQVVYSPEDVQGGIVRPKNLQQCDGDDSVKNGATVGTISYMPAIFGCHCASVVLRELSF